jgi:hypothetical protein
LNAVSPQSANPRIVPQRTRDSAELNSRRRIGLIDRETAMPYALFEDDEQLTRSFPTEEDVWAAAERAGLVEIRADGVKALEDNFRIKPCESTPDETIDPDSDFIFS